MNRRQRVAVAVLVTLAAIPAGWLYGLAEHRMWQARENDAWTEITSSQTAPSSWTVTGQPPLQHYQQCLHGVADYDTAAAHLNDPPLNPSTECPP